MDTGNLILHIISIIGFGILCFAAGMTFKQEPYISMVQLMIALTVINKTVHALIECGPPKPKRDKE